MPCKSKFEQRFNMSDYYRKLFTGYAVMIAIFTVIFHFTNIGSAYGLLATTGTAAISFLVIGKSGHRRKFLSPIFQKLAQKHKSKDLEMASLLFHYGKDTTAIIKLEKAVKQFPDSDELRELFEIINEEFSRKPRN